MLHLLNRQKTSLTRKVKTTLKAKNLSYKDFKHFFTIFTLSLFRYFLLLSDQKQFFNENTEKTITDKSRVYPQNANTKTIVQFLLICKGSSRATIALSRLFP